MKYFIDTEFLEGVQTNGGPLFNFLTSKKKNMPTIDLISIGIVAEDDREYYAISKDFNFKEAWNRYDWKRKSVHDGIPGPYKEYWIRENVLKPIWIELKAKEYFEQGKGMPTLSSEKNHIEFNKAFIRGQENMTYKNLKRLINKYGKTNKQIAEDVKEFCSIGTIISNRGLNVRTYTKFDDSVKTWIEVETIEKYYPIHFDNKPVFYGYYADYDWVVFCWLFGNMSNLPKNFPMYCIDLKQELERVNETLGYNCDSKGNSYRVQEHPEYPKQINEHSALADARWNEDLFNFLEMNYGT